MRGAMRGVAWRSYPIVLTFSHVPERATAQARLRLALPRPLLPRRIRNPAVERVEDDAQSERKKYLEVSAWKACARFRRISRGGEDERQHAKVRVGPLAARVAARRYSDRRAAGEEQDDDNGAGHRTGQT